MPFKNVRTLFTGPVSVWSLGSLSSKLTERTGIAARLGEGIDNEDKEEEDRAERTSAARRGRKGKGKYDELTKSSEVQTNNVQ